MAVLTVSARPAARTCLVGLSPLALPLDSAPLVVAAVADTPVQHVKRVGLAAAGAGRERHDRTCDGDLLLRLLRRPLDHTHRTFSNRGEGIGHQ
eukprot:6917958-Alexandrium_andersonii.AAC.1